MLDLDDARWLGPRLAIVNPIRWELGHLAWFQEHWVLRHARGRAPLRADGDALYDSAKVAHDTRWDLPLPDRAATLGYLRDVLARVKDALGDGVDPAAYFARLALFHEDMHGEALTYTRQTLGYPAPPSSARGPEGIPIPVLVDESGALEGDTRIESARFVLGAPEASARNENVRRGFVFDNEKWGHPVDVPAFAIGRAPVTNVEYARFVDANGYAERQWWSHEGWAWRALTNARHPRYWRRGTDGAWAVRRWDTLAELEPHHPIVHVSWFEADAFARWSGRRLPTEAEWELAAAGPSKRRFPWGDAEPGAAHANLDATRGGTVDVRAFAAGDTPEGCRQMIGNVWEWTASDFAPYPGFVVDPYAEYSAPWFSGHKVLRGGCWATRGRLLRNTWRNFYTPDRSDVLVGFRTCVA